MVLLDRRVWKRRCSGGPSTFSAKLGRRSLLSNTQPMTWPTPDASIQLLAPPFSTQVTPDSFVLVAGALTEMLVSFRPVTSGPKVGPCSCRHYLWYSSAWPTYSTLTAPHTMAYHGTLTACPAHLLACACMQI